MIRRNCCSLVRFGALAAALLLALPALADEIEPEPYVEEEVVESEAEPEPVVEAEVEEEVESKVARQRARFIEELFDLIIMRPFGLGMTVVGGALFLPAAVLASPSGAEGILEVWEQFVVPSMESTFKHPLGEF